LKEKVVPAARELVSRLLHAQDLQEQRLPSRKEIQDCRKAMDQWATIIRKTKEERLDGLLAEAAIAMDELGERLAKGQEIPAILEMLDQWPPPISAVATNLLQRGRQSDEPGAADIAESLPVLRRLQRSLQAYQRAATALSELRLDDALAVDIELPPQHECPSSGPVARTRMAIGSRFTHHLEAARLLKTAQETLVGANPPPLEFWDDPRREEAVLSCDTLSREFRDCALTNVERTKPCGEFDRYFGVEDFHYICTAKLHEMWVLRRPVTPFRTIVASSLESYQAIGELLDHVTDLECDWNTGRFLDERVKPFQRYIEVRDRIIQRMINEARHNRGRRRLIAAVVALKLSGELDEMHPEAPLQMDGKSLREEAYATFESIEEQLRPLYRQFEKLSREARIAKGEEILRIGLPLTPQVKNVLAAPGMRPE
jgi:hypothetical protein